MCVCTVHVPCGIKGCSVYSMCSCGYSLVSSTATVSTHISGRDYHVRPPRSRIMCACVCQVVSGQYCMYCIQCACAC